MRESIPVSGEVITHRLAVVDRDGHERIVARVGPDGEAILEVLLPPGASGRSGVVVYSDPHSLDGVAIGVQLLADGESIDAAAAWQDRPDDGDPWLYVLRT
jgi:hypothetical protein